MPEADLRATFPLTLRHVGEGFLEEYRTQGGSRPFAEYVASRFSMGTIPHRAVRDLVHYEAEVARLRALPPPAPQEGPLPPHDVPLRLSPGVALLTYGADLPGVLEALEKGEPARPRPRRNWFLLVPRGGGRVEVRHLERDEGWLYEWFRTPTPLSGVLAMLDGPEDALPAWREGILVKA